MPHIVSVILPRAYKLHVRPEANSPDGTEKVKFFLIARGVHT